jgi:hypothetical protein
LRQWYQLVPLYQSAAIARAGTDIASNRGPRGQIERKGFTSLVRGSSVRPGLKEWANQMVARGQQRSEVAKKKGDLAKATK